METYNKIFEAGERKLVFSYLPVMGIPVNISIIADMIESYFNKITTDKNYSHIVIYNRKVPMKDEFLKLFDMNHPEFMPTTNENIMTIYLSTKAEYRDDFIRNYLQIIHDLDYYIFTKLFEEDSKNEKKG